MNQIPPRPPTPLTRDVEPDSGGAPLQRHHAHDLRHFVIFHDCKIVERLVEEERQSRGRPPDPLNVEAGCRPLLRSAVVRGFDLSRAEVRMPTTQQAGKKIPIQQRRTKINNYKIPRRSKHCYQGDIQSECCRSPQRKPSWTTTRLFWDR